MRKLIAVILALALSTLAIAMAEATDYLGTWYLNEMTMGDASIAPTALGMDLTMEIKEDGTAVLTAPSEEDAEQAATWTLDGDTKLNLNCNHLRASFPPCRYFTSVNVALLRLPPFSLGRTKNPLRICSLLD